MQIRLSFSSPPSPLTATLFITIRAFAGYDPVGLVYSIHDSTEVAIQKMINASQKMITTHTQVPGEASEGWGINPVMKRHLELEIRTLQNAPRDAAKLRKLLELKQRQKDEADHIGDTQMLVAEIEMLKVVLYLVYIYVTPSQMLPAIITDYYRAGLVRRYLCHSEIEVWLPRL
jgi:hypothetical protein